MIDKILNKRSFTAFNLVFVGIFGLWFMDKLNGDGNGVVGNLNLIPVIKIGFILFFTFLLWLAIKQKVGYAQNILLLVVVLGLTLFFFEWICGKWIDFQARNAPKIEGPKHSMMLDETLGYKPNPSSALEGIRTKDSQEIYHIRFETDSNALRKTPANETFAQKYVQFYGCSMTFGEGVQSNETLPYFFSKIDSTYRPYNFAFSGYGPHQMLARLQSGQVSQVVSQKNGVAVYVFIQDHVNRVINSLTNYSYNRGNVPCYELEEGKLVRHETFAQSHHLRNFLFDVMLKSNIFKAFKIGYPFKLSEADYELTAMVIEASAKEYQKQFQNNDFVVVIYPTTIDNSLFVKTLTSKGIRVLDYSKLFDPKDPQYAIPFDEHPTALANEVLIKQLYKDLSKNNK